MMIETEYDEYTYEKNVHFSFSNTTDTKAKLILLKNIVGVIFDEEESENIREYLKEYKPLTKTQLRNRKIFKAIQDENLSTLNGIFKFSELTRIEKYINDEIIKLKFDKLELQDINILLQFKEDYDVEIEITVSRNKNDVWIIKLK